MICSKCKTNQATFVYKQNINGKESTMALCQGCAKDVGIVKSMVSPLFTSFLNNSSNVHRPHVNTKKCTLCALTFNDILSIGKVGCPECYNTFKEELRDTIRSIHGTAKHVGLTPNGNVQISNEVSEEEKLRVELENAIKEENYEKAAEIRDTIRALKGDLK